MLEEGRKERTTLQPVLMALADLQKSFFFFSFNHLKEKGTALSSLESKHCLLIVAFCLSVQPSSVRLFELVLLTLLTPRKVH